MTTAPALISVADIYLASLPSETGRDNGIRPQLRAIARMLGHDDYRNVDWRTLRPQPHVRLEKVARRVLVVDLRADVALSRIK